MFLGSFGFFSGLEFINQIHDLFKSRKILQWHKLGPVQHWNEGLKQKQGFVEEITRAADGSTYKPKSIFQMSSMCLSHSSTSNAVVGIVASFG